jgi:hypothetical protein
LAGAASDLQDPSVWTEIGKRDEVGEQLGWIGGTASVVEFGVLAERGAQYFSVDVGHGGWSSLHVTRAGLIEQPGAGAGARTPHRPDGRRRMRGIFSAVIRHRRRISN